MNTIAIRREDKNEWERRTPLVPADLKPLIEKGLSAIVEPSDRRVYTDNGYAAAGVRLSGDLSDAGVVFGVKEMPGNFFMPGKTYLFFSHTIKGQPYNMPMLKKMIQNKCTLIDYERIAEKDGLRLIFFGRYAGIAGMIETLHAYGKKMAASGIPNPFEKIKQPYQYGTIEKANEEIYEVAEMMKKEKLPKELCPLTIGLTGYGNVSIGAREILRIFPFEEISPIELIRNFKKIDNIRDRIFKIVFREEDMVQPNDGAFSLNRYYTRPQEFVSVFERYLPFLSIMVNCIFWTDDYPRFVTKGFLAGNRYQETGRRLKVIGDITCDINGSVEITYKATLPDQPSYTYFPRSNHYAEGVEAEGITVMAVDNLPCEFPKESSDDFSAALRDYVMPIAAADFARPLERLAIPDPVKRAIILKKGEFTDSYKYMEAFVG